MIMVEEDETKKKRQLESGIVGDDAIYLCEFIQRERSSVQKEELIKNKRNGKWDRFR